MQPSAVLPEFAYDTPKQGPPEEALPPGSTNPEAPWGINPETGKPYTKSPEERAAFGARMAAAREAAKLAGKSRPRKSPPRKGPGRAAPSRTAKPEVIPQDIVYAETIAGLLQIPAFALGVAGRFVPVLALDSLAVSRSIPALAEAGAEIAMEDARWAAVLDRAGQAGPWAKLAIAAMPLLGQLAANHRIIAPNPEMGILSPEDLVREMIPEAVQEAPQ